MGIYLYINNSHIGRSREVLFMECESWPLLAKPASWLLEEAQVRGWSLQETKGCINTDSSGKSTLYDIVHSIPSTTLDNAYDPRLLPLKL